MTQKELLEELDRITDRAMTLANQALHKDRDPRAIKEELNKLAARRVRLRGQVR